MWMGCVRAYVGVRVHDGVCRGVGLCVYECEEGAGRGLGAAHAMVLCGVCPVRGCMEVCARVRRCCVECVCGVRVCVFVCQ